MLHKQKEQGKKSNRHLQSRGSQSQGGVNTGARDGEREMEMMGHPMERDGKTHCTGCVRKKERGAEAQQPAQSASHVMPDRCEHQVAKNTCSQAASIYQKIHTELLSLPHQVVTVNNHPFLPSFLVLFISQTHVSHSFCPSLILCLSRLKSTGMHGTS
jgi:hypothetical protein